MANTGDCSNRRIFIVPTECLTEKEDGKDANSSSLVMLNLRHPFSGEDSRFLFQEKTGNLYELTSQKDKYGSWFVDSNVQQDGALFFASKLDPLFLILPYLKNEGKDGKFILLDQMLKDEKYPDCRKLAESATHEQLSNIAEISGSGDFIGFKFSQEKTLLWLSKKVKSVRDEIKSSAMFIAASDEDDKENEDVHQEYAFGIVSNYLTEDVSSLLQKHLNIRIRAEKRRSVDLWKQRNAKKKKNYPDLEKSKKKPKMTKAQRELSKVDTKGMKSKGTNCINSLISAIYGATGGQPSVIELPQLEFHYSPLSADKAVGPEGGSLSVEECSLTIRPESLFDTRNLSISMWMNFQNLDLPADRIPVSPYLDVKFCGKLCIPAIARVPTWFRPSDDSDHGIKIYKRYRDEENKFVWRELQNEVTVHDEMIEFEVDHFCGFLAMRILNSIKDLIWGNGEYKLTHGLFHLGENFQSAICYRTPESLFQQMIAHLEKLGYKEIHRNRFVMKSTQKIPVRMECFDPHLYEFHPQQHLLTPTDITSNESVQFCFVLRQLMERKDEVFIKYIVDDLLAPFKVRLLDTKGAQKRKESSYRKQVKVNVKVEGDKSVTAQNYADHQSEIASAQTGTKFQMKKVRREQSTHSDDETTSNTSDPSDLDDERE